VADPAGLNPPAQPAAPIKLTGPQKVWRALSGRWVRAALVVVVAFIVALLLDAQQGSLNVAMGGSTLAALEFLLFIVFAIVFVYSAQAGAVDWHLMMRRRVFYMNSLILVLLFALAVLHFRFPIDDNVPWLKASTHAIWFAMLGSVAISFRGIYEHPQAAEWDEGWWLWYLGRPFTGAIVGSVVYLLLQVANPKEPPSIPSLAVAAFVFGTQESRFFGFLYEVGKLVLTTPADQQAQLKITQVTPATGKAGSAILMTGTGLQPGASGYIDAKPITAVAVAPDGTSLAGIVPDGAGLVDVVVSNPDGSSYRLPGAYRYV
jgi:hypothetical protein